MAFKCGHCGKSHDKVSEAQVCFERKRQAKGDDSPPTPDFLKEDVDEQPETMRPGAQKFLADLLRQFNIKLAGGLTPETVPWQDGKKVLSGLIDARRLKATGQDFTLPDGIVHLPRGTSMPGKVRRPTQQRLPDCEPGYYAVPDPKRPGELLFYWVKVKGGHGPYAGWTFVDSVVGGHVDRPLNGKPALDAVNAILEFGPESAGILYAMEFSSCYNCNKSLTKYASRTIKLGRHCASIKGKLEEWDALDANAPEGES